MKNIFQFIKTSKYTPWIIFVFFGVLASLQSCQTKESPKTFAPENSEREISADTFIPKGYVLIPLELHNAESLTGLLGEVGGVVDLYTTGSEFKNTLKVASKVKLLRAPLNPQQFAVLMNEKQSSNFLKHLGPFVAVVQNPQEQSQGALTQNQPRKIQYLGE